MSATDSQAPRGGITRSRAIAAIVGLAAVAVAVAVTLQLGDNGSDDGPGGEGTAAETTAESTPGSSPGASDTSSPSADADPSGAPEGSPSGGASSTAGGEPSASGGANTRKPLSIPFNETVSPTANIDIDIVEVESVRSRAEIPGETSRPSLRITVRIQNDTDESVATNNGLANLYYGPERQPANTSDRPGGRPFPRSIAPRQSATGTFIFNVPQAERDQVALEVSVAADIRRVEFSGNCSGSC